jgi:hypothetical protein
LIKLKQEENNSKIKDLKDELKRINSTEKKKKGEIKPNNFQIAPIQ